MAVFDKITNFVDNKLAGPMARVAEQRHLRAIRDGIISTLPIIIVSSFLMVIAFSFNQMPADWGIAMWLKANAVKILLPYRMGMYILALYACFGIGYSLGKSYKVDGLMSGLLSVMAMLLTIVPTMMPDLTDAVTAAISASPELTEAGFGPAMEAVNGAYVLNMNNLGTGQLFVAFIAAFAATEIYRFCIQKKITIKMPPQVPAAVSNSFAALIPTAIVFLLFSSICIWGGFDIHNFISTLIAPLVSGTDTLAAALVVILLEMVFWFFGIHGSSVVYSIVRPPVADPACGERRGLRRRQRPAPHHLRTLLPVVRPDRRFRLHHLPRHPDVVRLQVQIRQGHGQGNHHPGHLQHQRAADLRCSAGA